MTRNIAYALPSELLAEARNLLEEARLKEDVVAIVRRAARGAVEADGVTFVLKEGNLCHYVEEDAISPLWKGRKFPATSCISGWAMINNQTAIVPDIMLDARIPLDAYLSTFVKSLIMAPVRAPSPVAAIGAYWQKARTFSPEDVRRVNLMAEFVGAALSRIQAA